MAALMKELHSRVDRYAGLSDRNIPVNLTRIENPDLLNADYSGRAFERRPGYLRLHTNQMRDASARLDGFNDYIRIGHRAAYVPSTNGLYTGGCVVMRHRPAATATLYCRGNLAANANQFLVVRYNPAGGTGSAGAWVITMYDAGAAALRTITLDDADPVGQFRFWEVYLSAATVQTARIIDYTGAVITSSTAVWTSGGAYSSNTEDALVGVSNSAAATLGTDYLNCSVAELRVYVGTVANIATRIASSTNGYATHEIPDPSISDFTGYWRLNDGTSSGSVRDFTSAANNGLVPGNPPDWVSGGSLVLGQSGLRFQGRAAYVHVQGAGTVFDDVFASVAGNPNRWTLRFILVPQLAPNETTVRAQSLLWAGADPAIPGPIAVYINASQQLEAIYRDGAVTRTCTITAFTMTAVVGVRLRVAFSRFGTGTGSVQLLVGVDAGGPAPVTAASSVVACTSTNAGVVSLNWAIGRNVTSYAFPPTFGTNAINGPAFAVIDDVQLVWNNSTGAPIGLPATGAAFQEVASWSGANPVFKTIFYLKLNEGSGNFTAVLSDTAAPVVARILPEESDGIRWDIGLVDCYRAPETQLIFDYKRLISGAIRRQKLAISGCTLYEIIEATATAKPVAAGLFKGGKWTASQYGQKVFLGSDNGQRPVKYDGANVDWLGIRAPLHAPVVAVSAAAGTFSGTYWVYYTFRNSSSGVESNPSPGVAVTFAGGVGTDTIDSILLASSSDPQVDQRRVYVGLVGGADGGVAFLPVNGTISDNVTTTWTVDIETPPVTGTQLVFLTREEPPQASVVKVFEDFLFVAGNQVYPTRVWRSAVGAPDSFYQASLYSDLDLDSGDPVVAMEAINERLFVSMQDGSGALWLTGDSNAPVGKEVLSRDHGAIGPAAYVNIKNVIYYLSERDIWRTDGERSITRTDGGNDENISSPANPSYPSIQTLMRTGLEPSRRRQVVAAQNRNRNTAWFAVTLAGGTRNSHTIVYDHSQGIWSLYDLPLDYVAEVEDGFDDPQMWGAIEGFVCKLDTGTFDGNAALGQLGSTGSMTTFPILTGSLVANAYKGMKVHIYRHATNDTIVGIIASNTATAITVYGSAVSVTRGDVFTIGGIVWYADWVFDFGDPMMLKRLKWLRFAGDIVGDTNIRISYKLDNPGRTFDWVDVIDATAVWPAGEKSFIQSIGGQCYSVRIRIGDIGYSGAMSALAIPNPSPASSVKIYELEAVAEPIETP